jgi:uncharacterized damage-inducible protein DinB
MNQSMNAQLMLLRMSENSAWSNDRLLRACSELSEDDYRRERTSFFPSLKETLEHIHQVDLYYTDALERGGRGRAMYESPWITFETFGALATAQRVFDKRLIAFVAALGGPEALDEEVVLQRPTEDQVERIGDVLLHLFTHQTHHRGQAHAMLAGTSVAPPQLDEFFLRSDRPRCEAELRALGIPFRE